MYMGMSSYLKLVIMPTASILSDLSFYYVGFFKPRMNKNELKVAMYDFFTFFGCILCDSICHYVSWSVSQSVGWSVNRLFTWLVRWLVSWFVCLLVCQSVLSWQLIATAHARDYGRVYSVTFKRSLLQEK